MGSARLTRTVTLRPAAVSGSGAGAALRSVVEGLIAGSVSGLMVLIVFAVLPSVWGWTAYTVVSGSMTPSVRRGDVVVAEPFDGGPVRKGEVLVLAPLPGVGPGGRATAPITHRVVELLPSRRFRTKGDANPGPDARIASRADVVARVRYLVPVAGRPSLLTWPQRAAVVAAALVLAVGGLLSRRRGLAHDDAPDDAPEDAPEDAPTPPRGRSPGARWRLRLGSLVTAAALAVLTSVLARPSTATQFVGTAVTRAQTVATRSAFYRVAVVGSGPVAYWRLDESSGTVAADQMGTAAMTLVNAPALGRPGALAGDGDTAIGVRGSAPISYGTVSSPALAIPGPLTVAAWTEVTTIGGNKRLVFKGIATNLNYLLSWSNDSLNMRFLVDQISGTRLTATATWPTDHRWHFVVGVYDGTTARLYLDGVEAGIDAGAALPLRTTSDPLTISEASGGSPMTGDVDEVAVWSRALTPAEILALHHAGT